MVLLAQEVAGGIGGEGWLIALLAALPGIITTIWQAYGKFKAEQKTARVEDEKAEAETKRSEIEFVIRQYQEYIARVRAEHEDDRKKIHELMQEHTICREEIGKLQERCTNQEAQIAQLRQRLEAGHEDLPRCPQ